VPRQFCENFKGDQIADRQTLHVKWTRLAQEGNKIAPPRQENEMRPPVGPPTIRPPNNRDVITAAPPISAEPPQGQIDREHGKSVRASTRPNPAVKGFWDWSR
jgi:hypothetical protein